jgi:transketolase
MIATASRPAMMNTPKLCQSFTEFKKEVGQMIKTYGEKSIREGFGEGLLVIGEHNPQCYVFDADLSGSTKSREFGKHWSNRFFNCGIAEQNMIGMAAGKAGLPWESKDLGRIAFACTFSVFLERALQQIKLLVCYDQRNVKIVGSHGGIAVGKDGYSHHGLYDLAILRILPNLTIFIPCDALQAKFGTILLAEPNNHGPAYIRTNRSAVPVITQENEPLEIGKAIILREGSTATIFACGIMVYKSLQAAEILSVQGISVGVVNIHTLKPLDQIAVLNMAEETKAVVTAEDHSIKGGLGSTIAEFLAQKLPVPIEFVGVTDQPTESGEPADLVSKYGLTTIDVVAATHRVIQRKNKNF